MASFIINIISKFFQNFYKKLGLIFIFFLLFPSISSAFIFSPIIQSLSTISIFFWSISIYFLSKNRSLNDLILSIFFIILSFLSYEISFSLIPINIFIYCYKNKVFNDDFKNLCIKIIKIIFFSLIIVVLFYLLQNFLSKFSNANLIKYGFNEEDFLFNVKKYFNTPLKLIFYEIPKLWIAGTFKTLNEINYYLIISIIFLNLILYKIIFNYNAKFSKFSAKLFFIFNLTLLFVFIGIFLIYLVATSVPDITGYYNRGLLCLHILFAIFFSQIVYTKNKFIIF